MTKDEFDQWPWLLAERQVRAACGYARNTVRKLVDCGGLAVVRPAGSGQARYRKVQVARLLGLNASAAGFANEPLLLGEKAVMRWTGYSARTLRQMVAAGGLLAVRPAGLGVVRFRKGDIGKLLGLKDWSKGEQTG